MIGGIADLFLNLFDLGFPLVHVQEKYITRKPVPLKPFSNILKPFSTQVWILVLLTMTAFSLLSLMFNKIYKGVEPFYYLDLTKRETSNYLFFLFSFTKISEPDPLPWFKTWSAGRFMTLVYYIMCALLIISYTCNLRTYMTTIQYEIPPAGRPDLIESQKTVYIPNENVKQRYKCSVCTYSYFALILSFFY